MKKLKSRRVQYESGGTAGEGFDYGSLATSLAPVLEAVLGSTGHSSDYTTQPIINAQTMRNMAANTAKISQNFGFGGETDESIIFDDGRKPKRKKNNTQIPTGYSKYSGITGNSNDSPTEDEWLINIAHYMMNNNMMNSNVYRPEFSHHGIVYNRKAPLTQAAFGGNIDDLDEEQLQALQEEADSQGISLEDLLAGLDDTQEQQNDNSDETSYDEEEEDQFGMGGTAKRKIEVEGQEVIQTPNGAVGKVHGPSHENGGVDVDVPSGTDIYSKRIAIDGVTMADRKLRREKRLAKIRKTIGNTPANSFAKGTLERTMEINHIEEASDMALQKAASKVYAQPKQKAAYGLDGEDDPETPYYDKNGHHYDFSGMNGWLGANDVENPTATPTQGRAVSPITLPTGVTNTSIEAPADDTTEADGLTTGDYVGLAGNIFNAVAPMVNTVNAATNTKPNINRFRGFGRKAIEANDYAQTYIDKSKAAELADLDTSSNSARLRNRNSARSVNTIRALDTITDMGTNKARTGINAGYNRNVVNLLSQRGQLENQRDRAVMTGDAQMDVENKADQDNYYSNMANNLVNAGVNIQGVGKNLNKSQTNQDNIDLVALMSKNGIKFKRKNGRLILVKQ